MRIKIEFHCHQCEEIINKLPTISCMADLMHRTQEFSDAVRHVEKFPNHLVEMEVSSED